MLWGSLAIKMGELAFATGGGFEQYRKWTT